MLSSTLQTGIETPRQQDPQDLLQSPPWGHRKEAPERFPDAEIELQGLLHPCQHVIWVNDESTTSMSARVSGAMSAHIV